MTDLHQTEHEFCAEMHCVHLLRQEGCVGVENCPAVRRAAHSLRFYMVDENDERAFVGALYREEQDDAFS